MNPENGETERKVVVRFEKKELKKACRTLIGELEKRARGSFGDFLDAMGMEDPSDGIDYEKFGGREAFEKAMDRCLDLDEEMEGFGDFDCASDGPENDVCAGFEADDDDEEAWVRAMDRCLDLDDELMEAKADIGTPAGCTGPDEDKTEARPSYSEWSGAWERDERTFIGEVLMRGAREMAKRRVMDGRLNPVLIDAYTFATLELLEKTEEIVHSGMRRRKVTVNNFLDADRTEKGNSISDRVTEAIREQRLERPELSGTHAGLEDADDDDYNRYMEIMDIMHLEHSTLDLLRERRKEDEKTRRPFEAPFDASDLHLNADGHTFRLEA